jgi:Rps23 Pro-64 3,4-dihydroxylase Tpa1-like proline 4-hydroxylase
MHASINKKYLNRTYLKKLRKKFTGSKPFSYLELSNFFSDKKIAALKEAIMHEEFLLKESDLFKFLQTNDLFASKNPIIKDFRSFIISDDFINYIEQITNTKLKKHHADMHGTCYRDTDFLLCHDDQLDKRSIALMVYLTNMDKKDGGSLQLFNSKKNIPATIAKEIIPKQNTLVLFKVSPISFHAVDEVVSKNPRIAISWWFYDK